VSIEILSTAAQLYEKSKFEKACSMGMIFKFNQVKIVEIASAQ